MHTTISAAEKKNVFLSYKDWDEWYRRPHSLATTRQIWQYIDPENPNSIDNDETDEPRAHSTENYEMKKADFHRHQKELVEASVREVIKR